MTFFIGDELPRVLLEQHRTVPDQFQQLVIGLQPPALVIERFLKNDVDVVAP